jgi:adenine-specific DNA-methyltransferase
VASIETLIAQIDDVALRDKLSREVAEMKKRLDWGLVFERHLPENVRALSAPTKPGSVVWERRTTTPRRFRVRSIDGADLVVVVEPEKTTAQADAPTERIARTAVLVEQDFAEPVFPVPTPIGAVRHGPPHAPYHVVVEGENYHAVETLLAAYDGKVDVIYLDPPYNTGNKDWSYNNDYVDPNDTWRPSKWLAFMERRLRVARRLLKPDGVIVVTIDRNEVHHLGMLLEQLFPEAAIQMATIAITPSGIEHEGLSRVDEYAFFCFFERGFKPQGKGDDFFSPSDRLAGAKVVWDSLLRRGIGSARQDVPSWFYPVFIDPEKQAIIGVGEPLIGSDPLPGELYEGKTAAWPIRTSGDFGRWRMRPQSLRELIAQGHVRLKGYDQKRKTWAIVYLNRKGRSALAAGELTDVGDGVLTYVEPPLTTTKSTWVRPRHNASVFGTALLTAFLGQRGVFSFPKSLYAVRDTIEILTNAKPDALILDFFAGSGTTLHATVLVNAQDGGSRRCVLITNNEVRPETSAQLNRDGFFRGDPEFEAAGVFEAACRPRILAAVSGVRPDGEPVEGEYLDGRGYAEGLPANVEFFRLDYLDPAEVEFGLRYGDIEPLLWLRAGGIGEREPLDPTAPLGLPANSPYAVLFDPAGLPDLLAALPERADVTHVFIVADSPESFAQIASELPHEIEKVRLYRDYLETLRGATR